jgi:thymidylate kinase
MEHAALMSARLVALCGIDGVGKSTQAAHLAAWARERGLKADVLWCRWDPLLARPAIRLLNRYSSRPAANGGGGSATTHDRRRGLKQRVLSVAPLRVAWRGLMVLDYGLRTSVRVRRARRRVDLLVLDRYWHDVIVDLSAGGEMAKPPRLLTLLLPRPDRVLVLELPEEKAIQRQPDELDLTHLRQRRRLYGVVAREPNAELVDASGTEADVGEAVLAAAMPAIPGAHA